MRAGRGRAHSVSFVRPIRCGGGAQLDQSERIRTMQRHGKSLQCKTTRARWAVSLCRCLTMTYFRTGNLHYHRRAAVSRSCSRWESVVPTGCGRQALSIGARTDIACDVASVHRKLECLPQQLRSVSNVLDDVSEKDGCEFALNIAQSLGLEIGLVYLRTNAPGSLRQSRILLDANHGTGLLHGQVFGQVTGPAPDVQYRFPLSKNLARCSILPLPLPCVRS
jgi:hypothetical protein